MKYEMLDVHLTEYKQLKDEQVKRIGFRDNLVYVMLAAFGAVYSYSIKLDNKEALLLVPIVCFVIGWLYINNDVKISQISNYLKNSLSNSITKSNTCSAFGWEDYNKRAKWRIYRKVIQLVVDLVTFVGTGGLSILAFMVSSGVAFDWQIIMMLVLDAVLLIIVFVNLILLSNI